ncbi:MAG: hypothetical protein RMK91_06845 [Pseudanabaenaceae cyanobacterium SKYGB_i_bin29]|nr:porin family protein [Pseudanabaenaceae cyanobacterium SKYG29]MDW8421569.1 hypothetical protein [Pseudanabaenaceae cyanobacterium SKYGB_i_bin29]
MGKGLAIGLAVCSLLISTGVAVAQPAYGSYIGVGLGVGVSEGSVLDGNSRTAAGLIALRYKFLEIPLSLRTQVLIGDSTAVVPTISYDLPLNFNTDFYLGVGAAIANNITPVGNKNSFVLQPGVDYTIPNSNLVIFGNAIFAFDAYRNSNNTATSLQTGIGFRF